MTLRVKNNPVAVNALRNLSTVQSSLGKSLERLSSGERINRGSDDPAGLIISERLRGQISGIEQAISNSEFSISMVQTAEGALTEVNNMLVEMRQLAVAAANEGANDLNSILALQAQLSNALESIDRVSSFTQFGEKKLLDGSRGTAGVSNNADLVFVSASADTRSSPVQGFEVDVIRAPKRAATSTILTDELAANLQLTVKEKTDAVTVVGSENETALSFVGKLREAVTSANLHLKIEYDKDSGELTLEHLEPGSHNNFEITSSRGGVFVAAPGEVKVDNGQDIVDTIAGEAAHGRGDQLMGLKGNKFTNGLVVRSNTAKTGVIGAVSVRQNALVFQVGPNVDQKESIAINDTSSSALARNIENESKFKNLGEVNITTAQGAQDSIRMIDQAINELSQIRGELGSFQKNALESNVATLQVTAENLIAAESSLRDTDIAFELAEFTKNRILTEVAAASVAQAGEINGSALLRLLRDL